MENYFTKFPIITYSNTVCRNITERVSIVGGGRRIPTIYYPYELGNEIRPDQLAYGYYQDPNLDWLIWLTNGITDPYNDWYLTYEEFNNMIIKKYGSIENAQQTVKYYANDWANQQIAISISAYNALSEQQQKYYQCNFGSNDNILSYSRKQVDWIANTNKIVQLDVSAVTGTYTNGEIIDVVLSGNTIGSATVVFSNDTTIVVQHVFNSYDVSSTVTGRQSAATSTIDSFSVLQQVIPVDEFVFWTPVYCYDYENNLNEQNKNIYLLSKNYAHQTAETIRQQLNK